jgi:hypothetical protein
VVRADLCGPFSERAVGVIFPCRAARSLAATATFTVVRSPNAAVASASGGVACHPEPSAVAQSR